MGFLADVASVWSPTGDLGHVYGGQYAGYLFPMGPFFALGDRSGCPTWLVHRLWLGRVLAVAAWGVVRLLDALLEAGGAARPPVAAGVLIVLNPYVVVFANRTSITLLAYAALPWLLLPSTAALRDAARAGGGRRCSRWSLGATGGGVNAAVIGWLLLGAAALLWSTSRRSARVAWRDVRRVRAGAAAPRAALASLWWIAPVAGARAVRPATSCRSPSSRAMIWGTTSASEALRLMGYWT